MRNNRVFEMTKEALLDSLRKSNCDIQKLQPSRPKGGFFTKPQDVSRSVNLIIRIIGEWGLLAKIGKLSFPSNSDELIHFVEVAVSDKIALNAITFINSQLRDRSNEDLVKEAREAIAFLKELGEENKYEMYEYMLRHRIGEV